MVLLPARNRRDMLRMKHGKHVLTGPVALSALSQLCREITTAGPDH